MAASAGAHQPCFALAHRQKQLVSALEDRQLLLPGGTWADLAARLRGAVLDELAARVSLELEAIGAQALAPQSRARTHCVARRRPASKGSHACCC